MIGEKNAGLTTNSERIGSGPSGLAVPMAVRPPGETESVLLRLQNEITDMFKQISTTEDKLSPILRSPEPGGVETPNPEYSTKLAQEINNCVRDLIVLNGRIANLRNRIEL